MGKCPQFWIWVFSKLVWVWRSGVHIFWQCSVHNCYMCYMCVLLHVPCKTNKQKILTLKGILDWSNIYATWKLHNGFSIQCHYPSTSTRPVYVKEEGSPTRHIVVSDLAVFFSAVVVAVDGKPVKLQLCDTAGQVSAPFLWSQHITSHMHLKDRQLLSPQPLDSVMV